MAAVTGRADELRQQNEKLRTMLAEREALDRENDGLRQRVRQAALRKQLRAIQAASQAQASAPPPSQPRA